MMERGEKIKERRRENVIHMLLSCKLIQLKLEVTDNSLNNFKIRRWWDSSVIHFKMNTNLQRWLGQSLICFIFQYRHLFHIPVVTCPLTLLVRSCKKSNHPLGQFMNWFGVETISKFEYYIACSLNSLQLTNINYLICHLWRRTTQTACSTWWNNLICLYAPGLIKSRWFYPLPIFQFSPVYFAKVLNIINNILHTFRGKKVSKEPEG